MERKMIILVCDDHSLVDSTRAFANNQGMEFKLYSTTEWNAKNNNNNTLSAGNSGQGAKILPFPGTGREVVNGKVQTINELESHAIESAIFEFNGNLTEAAKALGIGRATLYRKVKQYNIDPSKARKRRAA